MLKVAVYDTKAYDRAYLVPAAEGLAIEYAGKFALDQRSIDDAFFARLKEHFSDPEILELTILTADWMAFGRVTAVLDLDEACAWAPSAAV